MKPQIRSKDSINAPNTPSAEDNTIPAETNELINATPSLTLPEDPSLREKKVWKMDDFLNVECKNGYP